MLEPINAPSVRRGVLAASLGSVTGFVLAAVLTAAFLAEAEGQRMVTYLTGDPHGQLELGAVAIFFVIAAGVLGAPIGGALTLRLGRHRWVGSTAFLTLLLSALAALLVIAGPRPFDGPVRFPASLLGSMLVAGALARLLIVSRRDH